eukprot:304995-Prorocentrum_minimum.AAC.1
MLGWPPRRQFAELHTIMKYHWTLPQSFMSNVVLNGLNTHTEMFASPLNVHIDTHTYFSKYDRDKVFGAKGNAYDVKWE